MYFTNGKDNHEIILVNSKEQVLGKGYIYDFIASEIHEKDRVNYYIYTNIEVKDKEYDIKKFIVDELIKRAKKHRKNYPNYNARVYHCCFSHDKQQIDFYSSIEGFKHDEGMHILSCNLENLNFSNINNIEYEIEENSLNTEEEIQEFINEHSKVFRSSPYNSDKIKELKEKESFNNIAIYDKERLIGNILLIVEEELGLKIGWIEDMFVCKDYRHKGLGEFLVRKGLSYFKSIGLHESRLELWSANTRATNLYYKCGYKFLKESESSIGMSI